MTANHFHEGPASHVPTDSISEHPEFLSISDAAALLHLNPGSAYKMAKRGDLPGARKVGGRWLVHRPTLVSYFEINNGGSRNSRSSR